MSIKSITRALLGAGIITGYSATVYTLSSDLKDAGQITIGERSASPGEYSHSQQDIQKIRSALNHDVSGVRSPAPSVIPGADCVIYRNDVNSEEFHEEVAECVEPNLPIEIAEIVR